jgi:hypothetical protein
MAANLTKKVLPIHLTPKVDLPYNPPATRPMGTFRAYIFHQQLYDVH